MGRKLKVPVSGVKPAEAVAEQPAATPAQPTVADQAAELIESDDTADESTAAGDVHVMFVTGDDDCPRSILDNHGEVVLGMCRVCGRAEAELSEPCTPRTIEPEISGADVPTSVDMPTAEQPAESTASEPAVAAVPETVTVNIGSTEQQNAWAKTYQDWWEQFNQWERDVEAAKERHTAAAITQAQIKESHKIAKAAEEEALEELRDLLNEKPAEPSYYDFVAEFARKKTVAQPVAAEQGVDQPAAPANNSDAWRAVPITKLDLPDKLIERLQEDGLDTMGRLEDRRGEISEGKAKWPKGIGAAKITKIEDAVIAWLTANRDQAVFQDLQGAATTTEQPDFGGESTTDMVPANEAEAYSDAINARAATFDVDDQGAMQDKTGGGYWERGFEHYDAGGKLSECDLPPSPAQDDFIRGWLSAGNLKAREEAGTANNFDEEPPAGEEPELQEAAAGIDGPALFNPDDI